LKYKFKWLVSLLIFIMVILPGCQQSNIGGSESLPYFFLSPFVQAIEGAAYLLGDNYGLAIIFITIVIRLVLMPFMLQQMKTQKYMGSKMEKLKPEMSQIQKRIKETNNKEEQQKLNKEMFSLYRKHRINPFNIGCLPLIIQFPILMGLYYAIRDSQEFSSHTFLWFNLGQPDLWVTAIAGLVYYFQFRVHQTQMAIEQQKQMKIIGFLSPVMIVIFSTNAPAALPLYWAVGGLFLILQSYVGQKLYKPKQ
jgi:YidC/Oxa1 family membrane protein insertase